MASFAADARAGNPAACSAWPPDPHVCVKERKLRVPGPARELSSGSPISRYRSVGPDGTLIIIAEENILRVKIRLPELETVYTHFSTELCVLRTFGSIDFSLVFIWWQSVSEFLWDRLPASIQFPVMPKRAQDARFSGEHAHLVQIFGKTHIRCDQKYGSVPCA
eukprot:COSAG02_NODE_8315_length_2619_cov_67.017063_1_plen_164_part_00